MELESNKYKTRLTILLVVAIISVVMSYIFVEKILKPEYLTLENQFQEIQLITDEEYNRIIQEKIDAGEKINSSAKSKEETIKVYNTVLKPYRMLFNAPDIIAILLFAFTLCGLGSAAMIPYIFIAFILQKIWTDIKITTKRIVAIALVCLMFSIPIIFAMLILLGTFGQIPFIIYTLIKYITTKKHEDEGDIIDPVRTKERKNHDTIQEK